MIVFFVCYLIVSFTVLVEIVASHHHVEFNPDSIKWWLRMIGAIAILLPIVLIATIGRDDIFHWRENVQLRNERVNRMVDELHR